MNDLLETENNIIIYTYQSQSDEKNVYMSFLGHSNDGSFEFYLYSELSDINCVDNISFTNYLEKIDNYGEIQKNHILDIYYIVVKINSNVEEYDFLSFLVII